MSRKYKWLGDKRVEKDILDGGCQDINSREELLELAKEEGLTNPINWDVWQRSVDQAKKEIEALGVMLPVGVAKEVWVYTIRTGTLVGHYDSVKEAAEDIGEIPGTLQYCAYKNRPLQRLGLVISYFPLTWKQVCQKANCKPSNYTAGKPRERWVYRESDGKFLGHYNSSEEVAKAFNITRESVNYIVFKDKPYHKHNLIIRDRPLPEKE